MKVILPDVIVSNGVIQGIDFVFNVPAGSVNMVEYLLKNQDQFKDLTAVLTIGGLLTTLEGQSVIQYVGQVCQDSQSFNKYQGRIQGGRAHPARAPLKLEKYYFFA